MARVVRCPHRLQVNATRMRLLGDCCRIPVDMSERPPSLPAPSMEHDGPSSPEPVVHPVPVPAALSTNPIAASCDPQTANSLA
jgi:hypothetical protein